MKLAFLSLLLLALAKGQMDVDLSEYDTSDMTDEEIEELENQEILKKLREGEKEDDTIYVFDPD